MIVRLLLGERQGQWWGRCFMSRDQLRVWLP